MTSRTTSEGRWKLPIAAKAKAAIQRRWQEKVAARAPKPPPQQRPSVGPRSLR